MRLKKLLTYTPQFSQRIDNIILYAPFILAALMFTGCVIYELIQPPITVETRDQIYITTVYIACFFYGCLSSLYGRKYQIGLLRAAVYSALCYYLIFMIPSILWRDLDVEVFGSGSLAPFRSVLLLPALCFLISRIERLDTFTLCDYLTPYYFFDHGLATHGCWIAGCCEGTMLPWGLMNPVTKHYAFPAQPYVILLSVSIALWGLLYARKQKYQTNGKVFAVSLIVYGFFRYILEFFTDDMRVLGALSLYSIYSVIMVLLGVLVYFRKPKPPVEINTYKTTNETMEEQI